MTFLNNAPSLPGRSFPATHTTQLPGISGRGGSSPITPSRPSYFQRPRWPRYESADCFDGVVSGRTGHALVRAMTDRRFMRIALVLSIAITAINGAFWAVLLVQWCAR